ncbi:hypothetical protein ACVI1T_004760 [Rhizobium redzepovicii]
MLSGSMRLQALVVENPLVVRLASIFKQLPLGTDMTAPGEMPLTLMPFLPSSRANDLTRPSIAPFEAT